MKKVRIGLVGAGNIAHMTHLPAYARIENAELVAVCDIDAEKAKKTAEEYHIPAYYASLGEMLENADIDAVDVCVWNGAHVPVCIEAARAGKHVMCEKPPATSAESMEELKRVLDETQVTYLLAVPNRFQTMNMYVKELCDKGEFGEIYYAKTSYLRRRGVPRGWFTDKQIAGGGPVYDIGVHRIDSAWYLMGCPKPVRVSAATFSKISQYEVRGDEPYTAAPSPNGNVYDCEDLGAGAIYFENGAQMIFEASWNLNLPDDGFTLINGTLAGCDVDKKKIYTQKDGYLYDNTVNIEKEEDPFEGEIRHFVDCILRGERKTRYPIEQAIVMQRIMDAIYESAATGRDVLI